MQIGGMIRYGLIMSLLAGSLLSPPAAAQTADTATDMAAHMAAAAEKRPRLLTHARERNGFAVGVYGLALYNGTFPRLPGAILTGDLAGGQSLVLIITRPLGSFDMDFGRVVLGGFALEAEAQVLKHFGVEDHFEATLSWVLRSGEIPLGRRASFNIAAANGLSYAFSDPKWERGWSFERGVNAPRLLYHVGLEAELSAAALPGLGLIARIHHRSDAYGAFGPDWSSSNRFGLGLRYRFK